MKNSPKLDLQKDSDTFSGLHEQQSEIVNRRNKIKIKHENDILIYCYC